MQSGLAWARVQVCAKVRAGQPLQYTNNLERYFWTTFAITTGALLLDTFLIDGNSRLRSTY
jgi:hypothetical protein